MVTTIQIDEKTLAVLKKLKEETNSSSYGEAINKMIVEKTTKKSAAGSLKKYLKRGETVKDILKEVQNERRKSYRF